MNIRTKSHPFTSFNARSFVVAAMLAAGCYFALAIQPGDVNLSFDPGSAVDGPVNAIVVQTNGQVIIGGSFAAVAGGFKSGLARLKVDGSTDETFMNGLAGVSGAVFAVAQQPDGKILVAGDFDQINGVRRTNIARLNPDGTLGTFFQNGMSGIQIIRDSQPPQLPGITAIVLQPDGKVLVAGHFMAVNGVARNGLARLNTDGSLDASFPDIMSSAVNNDGAGSSICVALQSDGKGMF